jgi:hypothetical protein
MSWFLVFLIPDVTLSISKIPASGLCMLHHIFIMHFSFCLPLMSPILRHLWRCKLYNTSIVIPASHKRQCKANPVVSDETVMYGYESSVTLTTDRLHYKLQIHPLIREGAPRWTAKEFSGKRKEKVKSGHGPQRSAGHQDILTDWPSVVK